MGWNIDKGKLQRQSEGKFIRMEDGDEIQVRVYGEPQEGTMSTRNGDRAVYNLTVRRPADDEDKVLTLWPGDMLALAALQDTHPVDQWDYTVRRIGSKYRFEPLAIAGGPFDAAAEDEVPFG